MANPVVGYWDKTVAGQREFAQVLMNSGLLQYGVAANKPTGADLKGKGVLYYETDTGLLKEYTGAVWQVRGIVTLTGLLAARPAGEDQMVYIATDKYGGMLQRHNGTAWQDIGSRLSITGIRKGVIRVTPLTVTGYIVGTQGAAAAVTADTVIVNLTSGNVNGDYAYIRSNSANYYIPLNTVVIEATIKVAEVDADDITAFFGLALSATMSLPTIEDAVGFTIEGGVVKAYNGNGAAGNKTNVLIADLTGQHQFCVLATPTAIYYYVDGILKATHTTNISSVTQTMLGARINTLEAENKSLWIIGDMTAYGIP